jgi:hypothetical protein
MPDGKGRAGMIGINDPFGHIFSSASPSVTILHDLHASGAPSIKIYRPLFSIAKTVSRDL